MAIPGSGAISMSMFNTELGRSSNTSDSSLAGGSTPAVGSLFWLANQSGSLNQTAPHAMSEWYGYTAAGTVVYFTICDYLQADGSGNVSVSFTASETVDTNVSFSWTWTGINSSVITGTTTISSGNTYGVATVGGATADEFNSSILYNCPSPSSYGTQTYDCDSFSNCY
jgi:hypothetical protein